MRAPDNSKLLTEYCNEVRVELNDILDYWMKNTFDTANGGFVGRIDEHNIPRPDSPKGAVLNSRILWAFSSAYKTTKNPDHLHLARIAFNYLTTYFIDKEYGGVYWTLNAHGNPLDTKKQVYALAFAIYGCSVYFEVSNNDEAKLAAIGLYKLIEAHSFDKEHIGYLEAFTRDWKPIGDLRLSEKDANEKKTMNTHLHILEAYTALYRNWPDGKLKEQIMNLIKNFQQHIIDAETGHLILFFDEQWNRRSATVSFGHDIEAAWLLTEAAEAIEDLPLKEKVKELSIQIAKAAAAGIDEDGGLWYEYEPGANHFIKEKHSWVQAEAMVGFFNHWQITGEVTYLQRSLQSWGYIKTSIKDKKSGEWFWGRNNDGSIMKGQDKVGIWKCPYHNTRACIEIIKRVQALLSSQGKA